MGSKPVMIAPYMTPMLEMAYNAWIKQGNPAFIVAYEKKEGACPNCQDHMVIMLRRCKPGAHLSPANAASKLCSTWIDGDGIYPRGWYYYDPNDVVYDQCPECKDKII